MPFAEVLAEVYSCSICDYNTAHRVSCTYINGTDIHAAEVTAAPHRPIGLDVCRGCPQLGEPCEGVL